ncbi:MAG: Xaa-Pro aminopeptidase [Gammaproteobacteria bacterium]|nr:Xaa-Pro aminopeptidase [Gammaproteobacteria bacterium]
MSTKNTYVKRRQQLAAQIGEGACVILGANHEALRNGDAHYPFRQNSDFYYLTGFHEPNAMLMVMGGKQGDSLLFNRPRHPEMEQWTGPRLGQEAALDVLGVQAAYSIDEVAAKLPGLVSGYRTLYYAMGHDAVCEKLILRTMTQLKDQSQKMGSGACQLADSSPLLSEMRLFKSDEEIALMQKAADISVLAHRHAMQRCPTFEYEYQLEAELRYIFTQHGCSGVAYEPIVAAGKNACILHYSANHAPLNPSDLVLIDAAGEFENYAADITRTFPIKGRFSAEQRALYELVWASQTAAMKLVKPGVIWSCLQDEIVRVLTAGLCDLGLLTGTLDGLIEAQAYKRFYMHGSGHWLGLDVHDSGHYRQNNLYRSLEPGMVFTIEPGLYISEQCAEVDSRWHNIGIRIEDDILVTTTGYRNLSADLLVDPDDIEAWMLQG